MDTARFKKGANRITEMQDEIDSLMVLLNKKVSNQPKSEHVQMLMEDLNATNLQTQELSKESEQLTDALYSQADHDAVLSMAQMKKINFSLQQAMQITKQNLTQVETESNLLELAIQQIQEQNKIYQETITKFKDNLKQCDQQIVKVLDQNAYSNWGKIRQFFDIDVIQTGVPLGLVIKLQLYILKLTEICNNGLSMKTKLQVNDDLASLILEINSTHLVFQNIAYLEQFILNVIKSNTKVNLYIFIQKCLNQMHFNFCQLAQIFNQNNLSFHLQQQSLIELNVKNQQQKQCQHKKSQVMIELEKYKKQNKDLINQIQLLEKQVEKQIEIETQHLLSMYLRDKEQGLADIKKKYGKKYYENMMQDVKQEFKKMCLNQQAQYAESIEQAFQRVDSINKQLINNKSKAQSLIQQYSQLKFKQANSQNNQVIQLNGVDKREYLLELQQCKIQLLQIENKVERKIQIPDIDEILVQIQYQINDVKLRIQANNIPQKSRSDSIDTLRRTNRVLEHHRSQSQAPLPSPRVPQITLQLLNINLPINNPKEIFDSTEDPLKTNNSQVQVSFSESNKSKDKDKLSQTLQVQFNSSRLTQQSNQSNNAENVTGNDENQNSQNKTQQQQQPAKKPQLKDVGNFQNNAEQIHNSLKSSRAKREAQQKQLQNKINMLLYLKTTECDKEYDPIMNYENDPFEFGYRLYRIDNQNIIYQSDKEKINLEQYDSLQDVLNQFQIKFKQLEDIKIEINSCSVTAMKFQNIYESTLRKACVDSLALRHLRVRFFPFIFVGSQQFQGNPPVKLTRAAHKLQSWYKAKQDQKAYQKLKKNHRYRKNVIAEIYNTEKQYIADLKILNEQVILKAKNFLTEEEIKTIFQNCNQIAQWNQEFYNLLEKGYQGFISDPSKMFKPYWVVFSDIAKQLMNQRIKGFRFYFDYCSHFSKCTQLIDKLKTNEPRFKQFLQQISSDLRGMDLQSFLVKPVQRLPKYVLLFKDLEKHTEDDHPDMRNIKYLHKYFRDINEENNKSMDIEISRLQITEICNQLKIDSKDILKDPLRTYKFEEKLNQIIAEKEFQVSVHALSDMMLIVQDNKLINVLRIDSLSFVKSQPDTKYFSNLFQIVGVGETLQCYADSLDIKKKLMEEFEKLIQANREQECKKEKQQGKEGIMRFPVQVVVVGTEERNYQSFQKHTQYITEISINKVYQNIYIRFSEIVSMYQKYSKKYPRIEFPKLPNQSWLTYQKTKSIEERKFTIESFLQTLLQAREAQGDPNILKDLKLPYNFYELPNLQMQQERSIFSKYNQSLDIAEEERFKKLLSQKLSSSSGEILKAVQEERERSKRTVVSICPNRVVIWNDKFLNEPNMKRVQITMPDGQITIIGVDDKAKISEVLPFVAGFNGLNYFQDFRLYVIDQLKKWRVLDGDEVMSKVVEDEYQNNVGWLNKIEQLLTSSTNQVIIKMRKYLFMPAQLEEPDYRNDSQRLLYLAFSIIDDVYDGKLQLSFKDYCLFAALYYHMRYSEKIMNSLNNLQLDKISKVIPQDVYNGKQDQEWKSLTFECIVAIQKELIEISQRNLSDKYQRKENSQNRHTEMKYLAALVTINAAYSFSQGNMTIFQVQTYQQTQDYFQKTNKETYATIYLGFSIHKIYFLNPQRKVKFREIDYSKLKEVKSYPSQIILEFTHFSELIRFDTFQSYEIKLLIEHYKEIQDLLISNKLENLFQQ